MFRLLRYTLLFFILSACAVNLKVTGTKSSHYDFKALKDDSVSFKAISPYKARLDAEMNQVIAYSDSALTRDGFESSLGNFVCTAMQEFIKGYSKEIADNCVIFMNRGGLRNNLPKGNITRGHIFELMPFDNEIAVLTINGQKLQECIYAMLSEKKLISRNLRLKVQDKIPEDIIINDAPFDITKEYYIVTTDYLAMGGDNCSFFLKPVSYTGTGMKLRDAIIAYCISLTKDNTPVKPQRFDNIKISK